MKSIINLKKIGLAALVFTVNAAVAQTSYFFPNSQGPYDSKIPTPEQFLGYPIGSHYTRHDEIVAYLRELEKVSSKVHVQSIGRTYEQREQVIATFTSSENYSKLEDIRQEHLTLVDPSKPAIRSDAPVVINLGYSVHGNETSSGETSLLTAYYLAANQSAETQKWLNEAVIFIDPSLNPDGRDRAANWYNSYKSFPPVADPLDKEHQESWPGGRSNHYLNNLNRDWLNLTQVESVNRIEFFHKWYPNVQIDFHEQGANATYYFEPTPKRHESPIIPQFLYDENTKLAKYHAQALDAIGSLYFTKENYDNLSPIYGSTYPKFFGSVAATFEEASSGGIAKETTNGTLTFPFSIRNHVATSLSTIRGSVAEKAGLFKEQKEFFKYALEQGRLNPTKAFVFGDSRDETLTQKFLDLLVKHRVKVYELNADYTQDGKRFEKGKAYVVPSEQPNFLIVHSLFEENILKDSIYYDNTGWSIIHAYGLQYAKVATAGFAKGSVVTAAHFPVGTVSGKSSVAYILNYSDYNASKALYQLLSKNLLVKTAFKPFSIPTAEGKKAYSYGSLVVPVAGQTVSPDSLYSALQQVSSATGLNITPVTTGFNAEGIDLGSSNIKSVKKPEVALAFGQGTNSEEAGQIWFLLNQQLGLPVTKIDLQNFQRASLKRYTTLVLPGGNYSAWDKSVVDKIKAWVADGGSLITFQTASAWAVQQGIANEKLEQTERAPDRQNLNNLTPTPTTAIDANGKPVIVSQTAQLGQSGPQLVAAAETNTGRRNSANTERLDYIQQQDVEGSKRINGAIFEADIDISHPIAFGLNTRKLFINKNGPTLLLPSTNKYATVAQYTKAPFINGYSSKNNIARVANSAAILLSPNGSGEVVLFADDPTYRSYWLGTNRLFLNAIFFAPLLGNGFGYGQ